MCKTYILFKGLKGLSNIIFFYPKFTRIQWIQMKRYVLLLCSVFILFMVDHWYNRGLRQYWIPILDETYDVNHNRRPTFYYCTKKTSFEARAVPLIGPLYRLHCFPYKYLRVTFAVVWWYTCFTVLVLHVPKPESLSLSVTFLDIQTTARAISAFWYSYIESSVLSQLLPWSQTNQNITNW